MVHTLLGTQVHLLLSSSEAVDYATHLPISVDYLDTFCRSSEILLFTTLMMPRDVAGEVVIPANSLVCGLSLGTVTVLRSASD